MFQIDSTHRLNAPQPKVWEILNDFGSHYQFNPYVEKSEITNGVFSGLGAERRLRMYDGSHMVQRIRDYQPASSMVIEVIESDLLIRHFIIQVSVDAEESDTSLVKYRLNYEAPLSVIGYPIGLVYRPILLSRMNTVMRGFEQLIRTGQPVRDRRR